MRKKKEQVRRLSNTQKKNWTVDGRGGWARGSTNRPIFWGIFGETGIGMPITRNENQHPGAKKYRIKVNGWNSNFWKVESQMTAQMGLGLCVCLKRCHAVQPLHSPPPLIPWPVWENRRHRWPAKKKNEADKAAITRTNPLPPSSLPRAGDRGRR